MLGCQSNINQNKPKISIIVPVYNVEKYLEQALNSAINQTLKDIEIICVNDASTDDSLTILKTYAQKDNRIKIIENETNQGPGVSRNRALNQALGVYIMFLDPDDWLELSACEHLYNRIEETKTNICFFNFIFHFFDKHNNFQSKISKRLYPFKDKMNEAQINIEEIDKFIINSASVWTQIYKTSFIRQINAQFSQTRSCEDNPFFFNTLVHAPHVSVLDEPLYNYRIRKSDDIPYYVKHYKDVIKNKQTAYEIVLNSDKKRLLEMFVPYYWSSLASSHLKNLIKYDKRFAPRVFKELHKIAVQLNKNHDMRKNKKRMDYKHYKIYLKSNSYLEYRIRYAIHWFLKRVYSVRTSQTHVITLLFGFKIRIRKKEENGQK